METTNTTATARIAAHERSQSSIVVKFNRMAENFEKSRLAWMALYITLQSCLGSVAVMYILKNGANDFMLMLSAGITMMCNSAFIAQSSAKSCLITFYLSMLINTILVLVAI